MEYKTDAVLDIRGNAIFNASVRVLTESKELATIYDANGSQVNNPLGTDATGEFSVALPNGKYFYEISVNGKVYETRGPISFFDPMDNGAVSIGYRNRTVSDKLDDLVSVEDYPSFQAGYDEAAAGGTIIVPDVSVAPGSVTGSKKVTWQILGNTELNTALLSLPGIVLSQHGSARMTWQGSTAAGDYATSRVDRIANHTGGTPGAVSSAVKVKSDVSAGVSNYEWAMLAQLDNRGTGENVALYGQANRKGVATGITWAGCFEMRDHTEQPNPTVGLVGVEVGLMANGTDANSQRVAVDIVLDKGVSTGAACDAYSGLRIGNAHNNNASGKFAKAIRIQNVNDTAIDIASTSSVGLDFSAGTYSTAAIRMASGQRINFSSSLTRTLRYEPSTSALRYASGTVVLFEIQDDASVRAKGAIFVNDNRVVSDRQAGFVQMTGTPEKASSIATDTATVQQIARRLKAIEDALILHGLIGT